jgi:hypothetical protein
MNVNSQTFSGMHHLLLAEGGRNRPEIELRTPIVQISGRVLNEPQRAYGLDNRPAIVN